MTDEQAQTEEAFGLEDVQKRYFGPDVLATEGQTYLGMVSSIPDVKISKNFDEEIPAGFGVSIFPISRRGAEGNEIIGVAVAAIPDPETIANHEKGSDFIRNVLISAFQAKVANAVRPRADGSTAGSIPASIEDFITSQRGSGSLKTYTAMATVFVKTIKKMGIKFMTSQILKQTLQSKAFAESQFPKIPQDGWEKILHAMVSKAANEGLDPAILNHWLATRNDAEMHIAEDLDFSMFEDME